MRKTYDAFDGRERTCPVCGKLFYPADTASWAYKQIALDKNGNRSGNNVVLCSYGCNQKYKIEQHRRKKMAEKSNAKTNKTVKLDDVLDIIDTEISKFDYKNFGILDELYAIREKVVSLRGVAK